MPIEMNTEQEDFQIEDGFEATERDTVQAKYPFDRLEVGQFFFVPNKDSKQMSAARAHWKRKFPERHWQCKKATKMINGVETQGTQVGRTQ